MDKRDREEAYRHTAQSWDRAAGRFEARFAGMRLYDDTYRAFADRVGAGAARILDLACGPGLVTMAMRSLLPEARFELADYAPAMLQLAGKRHPDLPQHLLDARDLDQLIGPFDAVVAAFLLPYLASEDARNFINSCAGLLRNDGILYLSWIEEDEYRGIVQEGSDGSRMHAHHYPLRDVTAWLREAGLRAQLVFHIAYSREHSEEWHRVLICSKP